MGEKNFETEIDRGFATVNSLGWKRCANYY